MTLFMPTLEHIGMHILHITKQKVNMYVLYQSDMLVHLSLTQEILHFISVFCYDSTLLKLRFITKFIAVKGQPPPCLVPHIVHMLTKAVINATTCLFGHSWCCSCLSVFPCLLSVFCAQQFEHDEIIARKLPQRRFDVTELPQLSTQTRRMECASMRRKQSPEICSWPRESRKLCINSYSAIALGLELGLTLPSASHDRLVAFCRNCTHSDHRLKWTCPLDKQLQNSSAGKQ